MTLPRRIQLVKLLRATGLRDVERLREDELKDALRRLKVVVPAPPPKQVKQQPSSTALVSRSADPPPFIDADDPHALPRFREPRLLLPDGERTFLRAIAVKPRLLFLTWDASRQTRSDARGPIELRLFWRDFLGDAPRVEDLLGQPAALVVEVDLGAPGWYVPVPADRLAIAAALVDGTGRTLATSNATLAPPARPAPPGPLWMASLHPSIDRRRLRSRRLLRGEEPGLLVVRGESDARRVPFADVDLPESSALFRAHVVPAPSSGTLARHSDEATVFVGAAAHPPHVEDDDEQDGEDVE